MRDVDVFTLDFYLWEICHGECYFNRNYLNNLKYELLKLSYDCLCLFLLPETQVPGTSTWWKGNAKTLGGQNSGPTMTIEYLETTENEVDVPRNNSKWREYPICRFISWRACKLMFNSVLVYFLTF